MLMELQKWRLDSDNMIKISRYWDSLPFRHFKTEMFEPLFSLYIHGQYVSEYKIEMSKCLEKQKQI